MAAIYHSWNNLHMHCPQHPSARSYSATQLLSHGTPTPVKAQGLVVGLAVLG